MTKWMILLIAAGWAANGALMIADPASWYARVPGVEATGPLNTHFARDIGFAFVLSAAALLLALARPAQRATWLAVGVAWPALHAAFHVVEWGVHGLPAGTALAVELGGVVLPVALGVTLALRAARSDPATPLTGAAS